MSVNASQSVTVSGGSVTLVNDVPTPAPFYVYGTNDAGVRGWFPITSEATGISGALVTSIATTGQQAWVAGQNNALNISGGLNATGRRAWDDATNLSGNAGATGAALIARDLTLSGVLAQGNFFTGTVRAQSYIVSVSGAAIPLIGASLTGTYNIDFTNSPALQTLTITGSTLFSGINYVAGGAVTMRVNVSGSNAAAVRFPALWNNGWVTTIPTGLATGRFAIMTINTFTANDSGIAAAWAVAP